MFDDKVLEFGEKFRNRLDKTWLDIAMDYIDHNEFVLAFETLCDYLVEHNILLSMEEYDEMIDLAKDMGLNLDNGNFKYLKYLARRRRNREKNENAQ